jgi:hypothetical protein
MSQAKAIDYLERGLVGEHVDFAISQLEAVPGKNLVAWFVVRAILLKISAQWESGALTNARVEELNDIFRQPLVHIISRLCSANLSSMEGDLMDLIAGCSRTFGVPKPSSNE